MSARDGGFVVVFSAKRASLLDRRCAVLRMYWIHSQMADRRGLQRLTQSRCWTSSGITDDVEDAYWVESGARWANKSLRNDEL